VLIRNNAPVFGASDAIAFNEGEWQFFFNYRGLRSDDHYNVNTQQMYDLGASYNFTRRLTVFGSIPIVNATWSLPTPAQPPLGPRREQNASGIGDISAVARWWLLSPEKHPKGNVAAGLGFKAPTGDSGAEDEYPNIDGSNKTLKAVDQSIQPGDGGWGVLFDLQGYRSFEHVTFFGSGTYLANPRDTNGTPSIIVGLGLGANPAFADLLENSVPDQYLARAGAAFPVVKEHLTLSLGFRMEGLPRYDLIGDSHGWRRPGYETFIEPGILYSHGRSTWSLYVPRGLMRNRRPNPYTGNPGDATFPDYIVLAGYSYRYGGGAPKAPPAAPESETPAGPGGPGEQTAPSAGFAGRLDAPETGAYPVCGKN
jgi:hypothetical protein